MPHLRRLAYVDLETTGGRPTQDRITEIGIVLVDDGEIAGTWSSLVNPGISIPAPIQVLTGISNQMVRDAPSFASLAHEILGMLEGRLFIAHNVRFDHGFLRNEFQRIGINLQLPTVCTVRLSRALNPQFKRHNLDSLIQRHALSVENRHRALGDAQVLPLLVARLSRQHGQAAVEAAILKQLKRTRLPPHIDAGTIDEIPRSPGVYLFFGEENALLYVGKSVDLRSRVLSHFSSDHRHDKEMRISQQIRRIEWIETAGELGALLREAELIKQRKPIHNRRQRESKGLYALYWESRHSAPPKIIDYNSANGAVSACCYGLFKHRTQAKKILRNLAEEHELCLKILGLEQGKGACFAYQLKRCRGTCVGEESEAKHQLRLMEALAPLKINSWPYAGCIAIREYNPDSDMTEIHLLDQWRHLGSVSHADELADFMPNGPGHMDMDIYRILLRFLKQQPEIIELPQRLLAAWEQPAVPIQYLLDL